MSIESVMPSNHLILCLLLLLLPSIFPTIRVFFSESAQHIRCPKYGNFSITPANKYSGLISYRIDLFDILADQGTLESFPEQQFKSIKSLVLSLHYNSALTSVHDSWKWKNHSLDDTDLCQQSDVSAFQYTV